MKVKRGRVPKPTTVKKAEGTYQPCRDPFRQKGAKASPDALPPLPAAAPPCPPELGDDARKVWHEVVPALLEIGTLEKTDGGVLRGYCTLLARVHALDAIAALEPVVEGRGGPKANPAGVEARKLWPVVEKLATDLGLHYAARARAGAAPNAQDEQEKQRRAQTEAFLFGTAPFTVVEGGKKAG